MNSPADVKSVRQRSKLLVERLRSELPETELAEPTDEVRARVRKVVEQCDLRNMNLKGIALESVLDNLFGFGPAGPLLRDPRTQNIFCMGKKPIYTEHDGQFKKTVLCFESEDDLQNRINFLKPHLNMQISHDSPVIIGVFWSGWSMTAHLPPVVKEATLALRVLPLVSRLLE